MICRIYYRDQIVEVHTADQWRDAPDEGVQVVVESGPGSGWSYEFDGRRVPVRDRRLWTGQDTYDPFGWGEKIGSLIPDDEYWRIWERACSDPLES